MARPLRDADARPRHRADSTIRRSTTARRHARCEFLARVSAASATRAFASLSRHRLPAGGAVPQRRLAAVLPAPDDYSRHITFNDDAMIGARRCCAVAAGKPRSRARPARRAAPRTPWRGRMRDSRGADPRQRPVDGLVPAARRETLAPAGAGPTSTRRSAAGDRDIVGFLSDRKPRPDVAADRRRSGLAARRANPRLADGTPARSPAAATTSCWWRIRPRPVWARFYEHRTNRPIYSGRDGIIRYRLAEIEIERRTGYSWIGPYAQELLSEERAKFGVTGT